MGNEVGSGLKSKEAEVDPHTLPQSRRAHRKAEATERLQSKAPTLPKTFRSPSAPGPG